ncbi:hypothetical protein UK23_03500 [Lentzea aerocolonigenes]|uniref:Uncharacterized protein n=1 Tax=Lentzea aerocolonigenes TaxID=68170 RepID=A0A0F0HAF6_LENAE|nr:hypothetical protein [Lentzea aerocolonigenes]KJK52674.1 hypothetical protein UK23_03500 [Lentzea aerocolonigenes]
MKRPLVVTIAWVLWLALGLVIVLGSLYQDIRLANILIAIYGGVLLLFNRQLKRGRDRRLVLSVMGGIFCLALWPLLVVVPAIVLQYLPESRLWFNAQPRRTETLESP